MRISNEITRSASHAFLLLACSLLLGAAFMPRAVAQDAVPPDQADLQDEAPSEQQPQPEMAAPAVPVRQDPCPAPALEMANTPDDLAKVQADIDRYTLCVERAQLLQRLNDLALENQERLAGDDSGGLDSDNPGMMLEPGEFAAKRDAILNAGDLGEALGQAERSGETEGWVILSVFGSADGLQARLGHGDGELAQVRQGDTLYDGSTVSKITPTGVTLTIDGEAEALKWIENQAVTEE